MSMGYIFFILHIANRYQLQGGRNYKMWAKATAHLIVFLLGFVQKSGLCISANGSRRGESSAGPTA